MKENEVVIFAGPRTDYAEVLVAALNEESIAARIVAIADVEPKERPAWACSPGEEVYIVVPSVKHEAALDLIPWVSRICLQCETILMPKVRARQKCGTPHEMEPGPFLASSPG